MNILFLCTGNSCRSIIAEAVFNSVALPGVSARSAGSRPAGFVHPRALAALKAGGLATEGLFSKSWDDLTAKPEAVITLCDDATKEPCPLYLGKVVRSHWGMPDPARAQGGEAAIDAAFTETLVVLRKRISALVKQLAAEPDMSAARLQTVLDGIAAIP